MFYASPLPVLRVAGQPDGLWRRLFMQALQDVSEPTPAQIGEACYAVALMTGSSVLAVVEALVELGLRAPPEALPGPWVATLRGRVLDLAQRQQLSLAQASLACSWGWMTPPLPRLQLPAPIDPELDPYGADLIAIFMGELGIIPRFGYTPAQIRLALLKSAVGVGQPLAKLVSDLVSRGLRVPAQAVPASCREQLRQQDGNIYLYEQVASWQAAHQAMAEVIPLSRIRR